VPLPVLAHQAPVLPLKLWRPAVFSGTALVLGSIAPDLDSLRLAARGDGGFPHSLLGQPLFCLPFTLAIVVLVGHLRLGEVLAARLGARVAWLAGAATDVTLPGGLLRAAVSALVGSFSHLGLDRLTHRVIPALLPGHARRLAHLHFAPATIVQLVASVVGAAISAWLLARIARRSAHATPSSRPGVWVVAALALAGAALGLHRALPAIHNPDAYVDAGGLYVWGLVSFFVACGMGAGILVAGTMLAIWDRRRVSSVRP